MITMWCLNPKVPRIVHCGSHSCCKDINHVMVWFADVHMTIDNVLASTETHTHIFL